MDQTGDGVEIRSYRPEDREDVARLVAEVLDEYGFTVDPLLEADLDDPQQAYGAVWVAADEGEVVGSVAVRLVDDGQVAELKRMYLKPAYRGRGLGRSLLGRAIEWAQSENCESVVLDPVGKVLTSQVRIPALRRELDKRTVAALRTQRARQAQDRLLVGAGYTDSGYVFCHPDGRPYHPERFSREFDRWPDLPRIRLHDLRHTWAPLALGAGVDVKIVAEPLGHASTVITSNIYQHVTRPMATDAAERVASLIFGS